MSEDRKAAQASARPVDRGEFNSDTMTPTTAYTFEVSYRDAGGLVQTRIVATTEPTFAHAAWECYKLVSAQAAERNVLAAEPDEFIDAIRLS